MTNKYIIEVLKEYERLQELAKSELKQRKDETYRKFPRIKYIDEQIAQIGFDIASSIFKGINIETYIEEQKKKMTDLRIEKSEILAANNYPIDYLELKYRCSKCKDSGYIFNEKCSCFKQKLIDRYYQQSNLKDILKRENFENFDMSLYSSEKYKDEEISPQKNMQEILTQSVQFYKNFDTTNENLFFYGNSGLGKTFLSNCIAKELLDNGKVVIYQTASNIIDILRTLRFEDSADKDQIDEILQCDLLIVDDLGTESSSSYTQGELFNIINTRILTRKKMIISTNLSVGDFAKNYPERITSRIFGHFTMFKFYGDDIRIKNNINKRKARA